jgi:hypothetical protein
VTVKLEKADRLTGSMGFSIVDETRDEAKGEGPARAKFQRPDKGKRPFLRRKG